MNFSDNFKLKYHTFSIHEKLIVVNVAVFAVIAIVNAVLFLSTGKTPSFFSEYLALPSNLKELVFKPWTLITYFFTHLSFGHLFGNMLALFFFGRIFLTFFTPKQLLNYYFLGGIFSGIVFIISYNLFPALTSINAILTGASASVFAILFGATAKQPNYNFNLFGVLQIPLWLISAVYTLIFISSIPYNNTGGELAHLAGAFLGYFYTKQLEKGKDIGAGFERLMDTVTSWFKKSPNTSNLKTVHKRHSKAKVAGYTKEEYSSFNKQKRIDIILDKIGKSGYDSLTAEEKEFLFKAGK